jgi:TolB-like protein
MSLFSELKYRNVFKVAAAYAVVGWLIVQIADVVTESFAAPDWVMKILIVFLLLGLPVALFLAWAFELTPEGVKRAAELPVGTPKDPRSGRLLNRITIATLIVIIAWLGWDKLQRDDVAPVGLETPTAEADKSIAVLPFADFSPDADHAWFADGLTDEILNALARTRSLRVASRTSAFAYRDTDKDAQTIAGELSVAHILEGSVRRAGDRIRVTAQLIRASDDAHLWSKTFDASSDDSIEIQENIAFEIASLLDTAMDPAEIRRMVDAGTESIAAWEAHLRIRELQISSADNFNPSAGSAQMLELYDEIVVEDPSFAEAHLYMAGAIYSWLDPGNILKGPPGVPNDELQEIFANATAAAAQFARSDDARLGAETLRAQMQLRFADLVELSRRRLQHNLDNRLFWAAHLDALLSLSRMDEARAFIRRAAQHRFTNEDNRSTIYTSAARLDLEFGLVGVEHMLGVPAPTPADLYQSHRILLYADRVEEAAEVGQRYIDNATNPTWSLMVKIRQACAEGRADDAERFYDEFDFSRFDISDTNIQWLALQTLGRTAEARELLRPLDRPDMLVRLAGLLTYLHFDPTPYPNLAKRLEQQGALPRTVVPLNFACKRD